MTATTEPSESGHTLVTFYDGSQMAVAELIDSVCEILCLDRDSTVLYEIGEQLSLW